MIIRHTLLNKQKRRKSASVVQVDLYPLATELYEELDKLNIIERMKNVPQLGAIRVPKALKKSRYDYTILQLYLHQLVKKEVQSMLRFTYNNSVKSLEFRTDLTYIDTRLNPSMGDIIQILTIAYNIGHFFNTFVASRAAVIFANENPQFKETIIQASDEVRYQQAAEKLLKDINYQRYHLLNSLLVLQLCDQHKLSVQLAQEIIYAYLNEVELKPESKLHYVFEVFRSVRNVSYIAYDLQIAKTSLTIDLCDSDSLIVLLKELLSTYNDNSSASKLVESMSKLLDDTVYNKESDAICYYMVSSKIVKKLRAETIRGKPDYFALWNDATSVFNVPYSQQRDYSQTGILKLTFEKKDRRRSQRLFSELAHTNGVRAGYYDRNSGQQTIVVSIKTHCDQKIKTALRVLKIVIRHLRELPEIEPSNVRYLLASKFFLFYLMKERRIVIKPTVSTEICVICAKGKRQRVRVIEDILRSPACGADNVHEVENLYDVLKRDTKSDVCISLPASIVVHKKDEPGKTEDEFDGMIIFPNRSSKQIVFLEAKNTVQQPGYGKKCLSAKLRKFQIVFDSNEIEVKGRDAIFFYNV